MLLKICQQSSNTEPKLIKEYWKIIVRITNFFMNLKLPNISKVFSESPIRFSCHLNIESIQNFTKKMEIFAIQRLDFLKPLLKKFWHENAFQS